MNVGLSLEIDGSIDDMSDVVTEIDRRLKECFIGKAYGQDVENLIIGVILTSPDVDHLHPASPLLYRKRVRYEIPTMEFANLIEYYVRPSFNVFAQLNVFQAKSYLCRLLVESLVMLDSHRASFPNFDLMRFKDDFAACLRDWPSSL
jgi:hypothetical protein